MVELFANVMPIDYPTRDYRSERDRQNRYYWPHKTLLYLVTWGSYYNNKLRGNGQLSLVNQLLRSGANPNHVAGEEYENSPLDLAIHGITPDNVDFDNEQARVSYEQRRKRCYPIAKLLYCYGGKPKESLWLNLTDEEQEEFEQAQEAFRPYV